MEMANRKRKLCENVVTVNESLEFVIKRLFKHPKFRLFIDNPYNNGSSLMKATNCTLKEIIIKNPIDLKFLQKKVNDEKYESYDEFYNDIKYIKDNCSIRFGSKKNLMPILKQLTKFCEEEINAILRCNECYRNANKHRSEWLEMVCEIPHLLVWARMNSRSPYWPAKAIQMGENTTWINVQFFGYSQNRNAAIRVTDCYLFSKDIPNDVKVNPSKLRLFAKSLKEVKNHIKNIETKFGAFNYAPTGTSFEPSRFRQHLKAMITFGENEIPADTNSSVNERSAISELNDNAEHGTSNQQDQSQNESSESNRTEAVIRIIKSENVISNSVNESLNEQFHSPEETLAKENAIKALQRLSEVNQSEKNELRKVIDHLKKNHFEKSRQCEQLTEALNNAKVQIDTVTKENKRLKLEMVDLKHKSVEKMKQFIEDWEK